MSANQRAPEQGRELRGSRPPCRAAADSDGVRRSLRRMRRGFTLVELLVVISIIGVLMALTASGVFSYLDVQKATNTETTIRTVYQVLQQHWKHVAEEARKETPSPAVLALANNDPRRAQVIWVKFRLMEAFPMSFAEIVNSPLYNFPTAANAYIPAGFVPGTSVSLQRNISTYRNYLKTHFKATTHNAATEQIACLLLALQTKRGGVSLNPDSLGTNVTDTDGDGVSEIVDGWGTPLAFYRFPTGNTELQTAPGQYNPNSNKIKFQDPLDPDGTFVAAGWTLSAQFQKLCHVINPVIDGTTGLPVLGTEAYLIPVIASAGRDGKSGYDTIKLDMSVVNATDTNDNICSHRLRLGSRGD